MKKLTEIVLKEIVVHNSAAKISNMKIQRDKCDSMCDICLNPVS